MMKSVIVTMLLCSLFATGSLHAQKIDSMLAIYASNFAQEKVYAQSDKQVYNPGETIWYKAYIFTGADPSQISRNFYTELTDAQGNILQRHVSPVVEGSAAGSFDIPLNIKNTYLHMRAYTAWMMNFDTAFVFEKDIRIAGTPSDTSAKAITQSRSLQFFPEGGSIIGGAENNIAFKAVDQYGMPIAVKGILLDASGKNVAEFNSVHDGMGAFLLSPDKTDKFTAVWKDDLNVEHKTELPPVETEGVVLRVLPADKKVFFSVARSNDNNTLYQHLTIIAHMHQQMVYKANVNLVDNFMSGGSIPTAQLPTGVLVLSIFAGNLPVAERVVFINNHDYTFPATVQWQSKSAAKRGRNVIEIEVPDSVRSNFSIAITDAEADGVRKQDDNIVSRLLLTGDIRGYVHNPYYYFSGTDSASKALDLVMLTHGWRRIKWEQLVAGKTPIIKSTDQDYISLRVDVLGVDPNRIAKDEGLNVILRKKDSSVQMLNIPRIGPNRFGVSGLIFYDTARAFYQFNTNRKLASEAAIVFSNGLLTGPKKVKLPPTPYKDWYAEDSALTRKSRYLIQEITKVRSGDDTKIKTLEAVTVKGRQRSPSQKLDDEYASGMFAGGDAYTFSLLNDPSANAYLDVFSYLQGKVAGLNINNSGPTPTLQWRGSTPTLYLNEMQVDASQLKNTSVSDVAMIKVFRPGSGVVFGAGGGGAIAVYTRKGGDQQPDPTFKGLDRTIIAGYTVVKQFYSPDYLTPDANNVAEDVRSTLYWNPWILLDRSSKKTTIPFYNSDVTKKIRLVLEGCNENGKLIRIEKVLE